MKKRRMHNKIGRLFWLIFLGGAVVKLLSFLFHKKGNISEYKKNFTEFLHKEKQEIDEVAHGEESLEEYIKDSGAIFKDFFIPHQGNDHKPKILRTKSLVVVVLLLSILKLWSFGFLLLSYPDEARLSEDIVKQVLILTNQDREINKLGILTLDPVLSASAFAKANSMVVRDYFDHYGPDGKKPWDWIDRNNYRYIFVGENLAMNFSSAGSAHRALMNSPTHKKNILNSRYTDVGLAMVTGEINGKETNVLVELFAAKDTPKLAIVADDVNKSITGATEEATIIKTSAEGEANLPEIPKEKTTEVMAASIEPVERESEVTVAREQTSVSPQPATSQAVMEKIVKAEDVAMHLPEFEERKAGISAGIEVIRESASPEMTVAMKISQYLRYFFALVLGLMILFLAINILVRIRVQHGHVIIQTFLVILFISGLVFVKLHFLENGLPSILLM